MASSIDTAISGLTAATTRVDVAAKNIANQNSTKTLQGGQVVDKPYTPQRVDQVSLSNGGVIALEKDVNPATTSVPDPSSNGGTTQVPNVDQADQLVQLNIASYDFKASLKAIEVQQNLDKSLLDIKT